MADSGLYDTESEISSIAIEYDSDQESLEDNESTASRHASDHQQDETPDIGQTATQASKAIEAAEDSSIEPSGAPGPPSSSSLGGRHEAREWFNEQTPLLDAGPAPPDYAAATAWRVAEPRQQDTGADTVSAWPIQLLKDYLSSFSVWKSYGAKVRWRKIIRRIVMCVCLLQLIVVCVIITTGVLVFKQKKHHAQANEDHPLYNLENPKRYHLSTPKCQFESYSDLASLDSFEGPAGLKRGDFRLRETMSTENQSGLGGGEITGRIEFRPAPYWQRDRIEVWFNAAATAPWNADLPEIDIQHNGLHIRPAGPESASHTTRKGQESMQTVTANGCYDLWIRVYVADGLENCELHTTNLDIDVRSGIARTPRFQWNLDVQNQTSVSSEHGSISAEQLNSRAMHIETVTGSIQGLYGFSEKMSLSTRSGVIGGTIFPFGNSTNLVHASDGKPISRELHTSTGSDVTALMIYNPLLYDAWNPLQSYHHSDSGGIFLLYGPEDNWQGNIDIRSSNGTIKLEGEGVQLLPNNNGSESLTKRLSAKRGLRDSELRVETVSGDIEVLMNTFRSAMDVE